MKTSNKYTIIILLLSTILVVLLFTIRHFTFVNRPVIQGVVNCRPCSCYGTASDSRKVNNTSLRGA